MAADANAVYGVSLAISICLPALKFIWQPSLFFFFFYSNKVKGGKERKRGEGAGNGVTDRQNHPKENRQCCSPHYGFRFWYEPEMQSGGHYIKPRSVLPGLISAVICVMARSMWMKSSGRLYYDRPSVKSRTKMRAVDRTLPRNCVRPTGWRAWFVQHAFKLENVLLSFLHPGTNVSTLAVLPYPHFFFPSPVILSPPHRSEPNFNSLCVLTDTLIWTTLLSSCVSRFRGRLEGGERWEVGLVLGAVSGSVNTTSAL